MVSLVQLHQHVENVVEESVDNSKEIWVERYDRRSVKAAMLSEIPRFTRLSVGKGCQAWAAVLFVDLRGSTGRAVELGPRNTYISMHSLLGTLAYLVGPSGGHLANYRGDGLFAVFGMDETGNRPADLDPVEEVRKAIRCGKAMIEAVENVLNPTLRKTRIDGESVQKSNQDLRIGVGIDEGQIVITRIGLLDANEVTAYGTPVNKAAKLCGGVGEIIVSNNIDQMFPRGPDGRLVLEPVWDDGVLKRAGKPPRGVRVTYPDDLRVVN